jgi:long-subunit acyl-CoA synthetase (AMP-forming)
MLRIEDLSSFAEAFQHTVRTHPMGMAVRTLDESVALTWGDVQRRVNALAGGLARLGVRRGDPVALLLANRPEFHLVDLAAMLIGGVPFSIYQTAAPEQIEHVVGDAGARVAVIERAFFERFMKARQNLPGLEHVVVIDGEGEQGTLRLADLEGADPGFDPEPLARRIGKDDLLTLIYTSGTTGPPKGVQLTHGNLLAACRAAHSLIQFPEGGRVISWLPSAHIAERMAHHYLPILFAATITTCDNPREIISVLPRVKPNFFFAVPRIWEKVKAGLEARIASLPDAQRIPAQQSIAAGIEKVRLQQQGKPVPSGLAEQVARAESELFSKLRVLLGLDQVLGLNVGAAPTPPEVLEFFHAIGLEVGEVWGMSETCGVGTTNPPGRARIGTVGPPVPGVEIRLAEDGEVLIRGECIMSGYRNLPEKTAETIDAEGWLHTGDVGEFDAQGYLRIIDRKKELIINAAGKNMSPSNIESTLKAASPLIGQVCVIGDARAYNTALLVLDSDYAPAWAEARGLGRRALDDLSRDPTVLAEVQAGVDRANERLSRVEQVKRFTILPSEWLPGGDELTPTMKLKRKPIAEKYKAQIEKMYASA